MCIRDSPETDTERLRQWSGSRVLLTYGRLGEEEQVMVAADIVAMWKYVEGHVARRVAERGDDLTSDLLTYADGKPDQVTQADVVNMVYSMALAGHETTCNTIGNGVLALLTHRHQWQAILDDRSLIPNAVEEILRFDGPVINHRRLAKVDVDIGGITIPAGSKVMMGFASGDRDPALFPSPDTFDVTRENAELHLEFGKGAHLCLGIALARMETRIILELLAELTPNIDLVPDQELHYSANALFRSLQQLMVAPNGNAAMEV